MKWSPDKQYSYLRLVSFNVKLLLAILVFEIISCVTIGQTRTIHVFVALCDNVHQGIVPVPQNLGNGKDPQSNLYWGAAFGLKSYFKNKTTDWNLLSTLQTENPVILERLLFKHTSEDIYLLADAYDGEKIKACIVDFLEATNKQEIQNVTLDETSLQFGGQSNLVAYIGHDGLMEFDVDNNYLPVVTEGIDVIILACYSKRYFSGEIAKAQANPVLWTTHLMAPEAYTLKSALDGWILKESGSAISERAAQTYNHYQKCGIKGARHLFTTGF